jgi:hypothetical protein
MFKKFKTIIVVISLACLMLVSCEGPDNCDLQMVAGGAQICADARK